MPYVCPPNFYVHPKPPHWTANLYSRLPTGSPSFGGLAGLSPSSYRSHTPDLDPSLLLMQLLYTSQQPSHPSRCLGLKHWSHSSFSFLLLVPVFSLSILRSVHAFISIFTISRIQIFPISPLDPGSAVQHLLLLGVSTAPICSSCSTPHFPAIDCQLSSQNDDNSC